MTKQDHAIYNWLVKHNPCGEQFNPIENAWEAGDSLTMYQTMLGNWDWCEENQCPLARLELEELAGGIGKYWHDNGKLGVLAHYRNGQEHGVERWFYDNGQLRWEHHWKNGERHGVQRWFYKNGQLRWETFWENGVRV